MKTSIIIFALLTSLLFTSCIRENKRPPKFDAKKSGQIFISKTKVGFNIYSNKGELILEYTKRNTDSLSLRTLDDIYETAKEFFDRERFEDNSVNENTISLIRNINYVRK